MKKYSLNNNISYSIGINYSPLDYNELYYKINSISHGLYYYYFSDKKYHAKGYYNMGKEYGHWMKHVIEYTYFL